MRLGIKSDGTGIGTTFFDADTGKTVELELCTNIVWRVNSQTNTSECQLSFVNIPVELNCPPLMEVRKMNVDEKYLKEVVDLNGEIRKFNDGQPLENVTEGQRTADQIARAFGVAKPPPGWDRKVVKETVEQYGRSGSISASDRTDGAHS